MAFFQDGRRPAWRPSVRRLARTTSVRTCVTLTLNSASSAALICGLVASERTRNAYSLRAPYAADDFSVTTGATIVRWSSGIGGLRLPALLTQRGELHEDRIGPENRVGRRVGEAHHLHPRQVAAGEVDVGRVGVSRRQEQHLAVRHAQLVEQLREHLGPRLVVRERVDHEQRALARPRVERRLLRELAQLLRDPLTVAAGLGAEHDAAVPPVRRAGRPLARAPGALLAPGLLVPA